MRTLARRAGALGAPGRARDGAAAGAARPEERHLALMERQSRAGTEEARSPAPPRPLGAALLVLTLGTLALAAVAATALSALAGPGAPAL